jgi:hypothetical protein
MKGNKIMKLRDRFWLWGQNAGSHHYHKEL